jgi:hypothetical protein
MNGFNSEIGPANADCDADPEPSELRQIPDAMPTFGE